MLQPVGGAVGVTSDVKKFAVARLPIHKVNKDEDRIHIGYQLR